jgi:hypothetical protein
LRGASGGIHAERPTFSRVAFMAAEQLGFFVKGSDVANAANVTSLMWDPIKPPTSSSGRGFDRPVRRQSRDANIATLANAVRELYAKLGEPLPDGFEDGVRTHVAQDGATEVTRPVGVRGRSVATPHRQHQRRQTRVVA